ncbi:MAG: alpha/beta hydrolase [Acidobacteria bacterium]|nr:alpha/beta hydrolase [Acidobacteriota bacterium]
MAHKSNASISKYAGQADKSAVEAGTAVSADGVQIRYELRGEGEPTLIFVHGWCCDRSYWREQLPYFAKKHRVVAIDLGGHGESGLNRKAWTMDAFANDVTAVARTLSLQQVVMIGHSMGGSVIVKAAPRMPGQVIGLVTVDQFYNLEEKHTQEEMDKFIAPFRVNFHEAVSNWVRTIFTPKSDPELVEWIVADMSASPPEVGLGAATGADGEIAFAFNVDNCLTRALQKVQPPLVFINSDLQPTPEEVNKRYPPYSHAKIVQGVGHFVMLEAPAVFNELLESAIGEFKRQAPKG